MLRQHLGSAWDVLTAPVLVLKGLRVVVPCGAVTRRTATVGVWEQNFTVFITDIRCHLKGLGILLEMSCVVAVSAKVTGSWLGGGLSIIDS